MKGKGRNPRFLIDFEKWYIIPTIYIMVDKNKDENISFDYAISFDFLCVSIYFVKNLKRK